MGKPLRDIWKKNMQEILQRKPMRLLNYRSITGAGEVFRSLRTRKRLEERRL